MSHFLKKTLTFPTIKGLDLVCDLMKFLSWKTFVVLVCHERIDTSTLMCYCNEINYMLTVCINLRNKACASPLSGMIVLIRLYDVKGWSVDHITLNHPKPIKGGH